MDVSYTHNKCHGDGEFAYENYVMMVDNLCYIGRCVWILICVHTYVYVSFYKANDFDYMGLMEIIC